MRKAHTLWENLSPAMGNGISYLDMGKHLKALDAANAAEAKTLKAEIRSLRLTVRSQAAEIGKLKEQAREKSL
jgi:hypothetical protein